jgi:hypothetical protein
MRSRLKRLKAQTIMTAAEFRATAKKPTKYRNRKVVVGGLTFDSQAEARRWETLCGWEQSGQITGLERQRAFVLAPGVRLAGEKRAKPALRIIVDFYYEEDGRRVVEDVKSPVTAKTAAWRIKKHLLKSLYGLDVREVA